MALGLISSIIFGTLNYLKISLFGINFEIIPMHFSFYAFVIAMLVMIIVSYLTKKTTEKVLDETQTGWYIQKS
ncbi:MAG: hypothetical protein ABR887_00970 [Methanoregulaceae archaeon]|jgi:SSS family solute:Na+ symporter